MMQTIDDVLLLLARHTPLLVCVYGCGTWCVFPSGKLGTENSYVKYVLFADDFPGWAL